MKSPLAVLCFLLGLVVGLLLYSIPKLRLSPEVNVVHLVNILTTLIVAFLLQHYLKSRSDDRRAEKNLIIEQAKAVRAAFDTVRAASTDFYLKSDVSPQRNMVLLNQLRQLSNALTILEQVVTSSRIQSDAASVLRIRSHYISCKRELTQGSPRQPISLAANLAADASFHKAGEDLTKLIMHINAA